MEKELIQAINNLGAKFDMLIEVLKGSYVPQAALPTQAVKQQSKYTFFEWLDIWFNDFKRPTLKDNGYDLQNTINKHLKPNITDKLLTEFDGVDIQQALNKIESTKMRQITYGVYNQCFNKAEEFGYITLNPLKHVKRPKHVTKQGRALTVDEQKAFLYEIKESPLKLLFNFYLLTGCRKEEVLSITWEDVKEKSLIINGTKTENATRELPLYPQLTQLINLIPKTDKRLFPYNSDKVRYHFKKIRDKLKFKDFTIHSLRHTFATRCLESGIELLTVQKWLGHADFITTANIYSHVQTDFEHEQIELFSKNIVLLKSSLKSG